MPCFFIGLKYIPSTKAALIMNSNPILVAVAAYFILKEQITKIKILSVFGAFIGVIIFTRHKNVEDEDVNTYNIGIMLV